MLGRGMYGFCKGNENSSRNSGKTSKSGNSGYSPREHLAETLIKTSKINEFKLPSKRCASRESHPNEMRTLTKQMENEENTSFKHDHDFHKLTKVTSGRKPYKTKQNRAKLEILASVFARSLRR